ncbi:hypothetical protein FACS1894217_01320 [Clostridia bacterium]|nr:hypothetical protein FACS1894217_01320 [Clostridia bacterium]
MRRHVGIVPHSLYKQARSLADCHVHPAARNRFAHVRPHAGPHVFPHRPLPVL